VLNTYVIQGFGFIGKSFLIRFQNLWVLLCELKRNSLDSLYFPFKSFLKTLALPFFSSVTKESFALRCSDVAREETLASYILRMSVEQYRIGSIYVDLVPLSYLPNNSRLTVRLILVFIFAPGNLLIESIRLLTGEQAECTVTPQSFQSGGSHARLAL
jgi:hypothetical protein